MLWWKALEMSMTKRIRPYADSITTLIQRDPMSATGAYNKVKSTNLGTDYPSEHVLEYRSYWLSMSVLSTLKYILSTSVCVSDVNK